MGRKWENPEKKSRTRHRGEMIKMMAVGGGGGGGVLPFIYLVSNVLLYLICELGAFHIFSFKCTCI